MRAQFSLLAVGLVLAACSAGTQVAPTNTLAPTDHPKPTATSTELVVTEALPEPTLTESPPQPTATNTHEPMPTETPTEVSLPFKISFSPYEDNPLIKGGDYDEWDSRVIGGRVVLVGDEFHLFYGGWGVDISGIGHAASTDGFIFTKQDANPIIQPDGQGFDALAIRVPTPLLVGNTWMLYYNGSATSEDPRYDVMGSSIGLATALDPAGPWTEGQLVLKTGAPGEWDEGFLVPNSVIATDEGYRMYYTGGIDPESVYRPDSNNKVSGAMCGMAFSADGINWTKYDNPDTTEAPFADSDPVLKPGDSGWDSKDVICSVIMTDTGWEMLYQGFGVVRYATASKYGFASSQDGVNWVKYAGNPVFLGDQDPHGVRDYLSYPSLLVADSTYYLYYSYTRSNVIGMGVSTGTITMP